MGNTYHKHSAGHVRNTNGINSNQDRVLEQSLSNFPFHQSGTFVSTVNSQLSINSVSRPWSRVSRRRWKESTLTIPFEASKTAWPVSNIESYFLPDFPLAATFYENNFNIINFVSYGAFGKVYKVKEKSSDKFYALKILAKSQIIQENSVQQVKDEVKIQRLCGHHPFIASCAFHWQTRKRLYIVSEFIEGGELQQLCEQYGVLPVSVVQIYVAEIALAIDFLHNAGVIYRDLKPENILLDREGHVQLVDFGLSKWLSYGSKTKTVCGTLRYMAPEVLSFQPYGHAADWWSLGVIACWMLTAKYPTTSRDCESSKQPGTLPDDVSLTTASRDLLLRLLEPDPTERLRSLRVLQTLAFYMRFDFVDVKLKKKSPIVLARQCLSNDQQINSMQDLTANIPDFSMNCNNDH